MSGRHRFWTRGRRRTLGIASGVAVLVASMVWTVRRQTEAREIALAIDSLESLQVVQRARFAMAMRSVDSLASRARLLDAAATLGLRPASDEEISFIEDVSPVSETTSAGEIAEPR